MLNVYFRNKNGKMFQIDLNSHLKKQPNVGKLYLNMSNVVNMTEYA